MRSYAPLRLRRSEEVRSTYFEVLPEGMKLEDAMNSDFWNNVRKKLRLYDLIEVVAADGSFDALIRVINLNLVTGEINFRVLSNVEGSPEVQAYVPAGSDRFEVKSRGFGRYAVIEKATGAMVADGLSKVKAIETAMAAEAQRKAA